MKFAMKIECLIDLGDPTGELEAVVSTVLQQYPDLKKRREILHHLELMVGAGLNAIDEVDQATADAREGGEAGETAREASEEQQHKESAG